VLALKQVLVQPVAWQMNGAHGTGLTVVHAPDPLQVVAGLNCVPVHFACEHSLRGSVPAAMKSHVPSAPAPLSTAVQASHVLLQAELQHTLSAQCVDVHWLSPVQCVPLVCVGAQTPARPGFWQKLPALQSVSAPHGEQTLDWHEPL
jgi:hypothetical protein